MVFPLSHVHSKGHRTYSVCVCVHACMCACVHVFDVFSNAISLHIESKVLMAFIQKLRCHLLTAKAPMPVYRYSNAELLVSTAQVYKRPAGNGVPEICSNVIQ